MNKLIPLLSDSIRDTLTSIYKNHESKIANDLLTADKYVELYNRILSFWGLAESDRESLCPMLEDKINALITDEVRALSIRKDAFEISFTPKGKELKYNPNGTWSREDRQTGKPGRIIKKLLVYDYKERDIELFSNQFKAELMNFGEFKIVSGDDICHWYNGDNYYKQAGTLGNSCMRYCECQDYFDVYKDHAKLLVCLKNDELLGRAIVWEIDGKTYMDRVYVCMDYLEDQFIQYAKSNKWYIREDQSLLSDNDDQRWLGPEDDYQDIICPILTISLRRRYESFPYMDSFRHFNPDCLTLSTIASCGYVKLSSTDGAWEDDINEVACDCCGRVESYYGDDPDVTDYVWSDWLENYLCPDCAVYNNYLQTYISRRTDTYTVCVNGNWQEIPTNIVEGNIVRGDNFKTPFPEDYFVNIDDQFYTYDMAVWNPVEEDYNLRNE